MMQRTTATVVKMLCNEILYYEYRASAENKPYLRHKADALRLFGKKYVAADFSLDPRESIRLNNELKGDY